MYYLCCILNIVHIIALQPLFFSISIFTEKFESGMNKIYNIVACFQIQMVNKCVAYGCQSGYDETKTKVRTYVAMFRFPLNNKDLLVKWVHLLIVLTENQHLIQFYVKNTLIVNL